LISNKSAELRADIDVWTRFRESIARISRMAKLLGIQVVDVIDWVRDRRSCMESELATISLAANRLIAGDFFAKRAPTAQGGT
jgi:hypothetical protein